MAEILRPPLLSQRQNKRPIAAVDAYPNLLGTTLASAPAGLNLPLRSGRLSDSAPRKRRWQADALTCLGFMVDDSPEAAIASLTDSAPRRLRRLSLDQPLDLLGTTLAQTGLSLPLLSARLDSAAPRRRRQVSEDVLYRPLTLRFIPSVPPAQLSDSAPRKRSHLSVETSQRPVTIALQFLLQVADAVHEHTADGVSLQLGGTLEVADAAHGHTVDNVALTQAHALAVDEASHGHAADSVSLLQAHVLVVAESSHGHTVDGVTLSTGVLLELQEALNAHLAEQPSLTQAHVLVASEALHAHSADLVAIFNPEALIVSDAVHAHICDAIGVARVTDSSRRVFVVAINRIVRVH